jgi:hypothetical protein
MRPSSPIIGAYFGSQMRDADVEGRLEPNLAVIDGPIHTAWDLGHGSNMAIWCFQTKACVLLISLVLQ